MNFDKLQPTNLNNSEKEIQKSSRLGPTSKSPTREDLGIIVEKSVLLENDPNVAVLIRKFYEGGEDLDIFDQNTLALLRKTLNDKKYSRVLVSLGPLISFGKKALDEIMIRGVSKLAAVFYGAPKGAEIVSNYAENYVREGLIAQGNEIIRESLLATKPFTQTPNTTGLNWLWEQAKGAANEVASHVVPTINEQLQKIASSIVEKMASMAGSIAGYVMYIPGAIGGYLVLSFGIGGTFSLVREIRKSTGFEFLELYIQRSNKMIEDDEKNEDGTDPRIELIVLEEKILKDPKNMGITKLTNEEWLIFVGAVRGAKVSLLREKTRNLGDEKSYKKNFLLTSDENEGLAETEKERGELISKFIENQQSISEADLELANELLEQFQESLEEGFELGRKKIKNHNRFHEKSLRYMKAFVGGGIDATGIPFVLRVGKKVFTVGFNMTMPGRLLKNLKT